MNWWLWVTLAVVLLLGAAAVLGWLGWRVFRAGLRLMQALAEAVAVAERSAAGVPPGTHRAGPPSREATAGQGRPVPPPVSEGIPGVRGA